MNSSLLRYPSKVEQLDVVTIVARVLTVEEAVVTLPFVYFLSAWVLHEAPQSPPK